MIIPTVGRVVWFRPGQHDTDMATLMRDDGVGGVQPLKADVVAVLNDRLVNLLVVDALGNRHARTEVRLIQDDDLVNLAGFEPYAEWMPYQQGQAKKAEAVPTPAPVWPWPQSSPAAAVAASLIAPRISPKYILEMMKRVTFIVEAPPNTTSTFAHAFLDGTCYLASGFSACVAPAYFDAAIGARNALEDAKEKAANKLWELEGYLLRNRLQCAEDNPSKEFTTVQVARVAHEVNRGYCEALGDTSQVSWEAAPQWQKDAALFGVQFHINNPDAGAAESHEDWLSHKVADGWVYGPVKDPALKQHPCMLPFLQMPIERQAKDHIFRAVVHALVPPEACFTDSFE